MTVVPSARVRPAAPGVFVHPSSWIEEGVRVGRGTNIWYGCHVRTGARIGRDCQLGQNVFIDRGVAIGDRVKIQNNVSVYAGVTLEDEVFCGPSMVFTNVLRPRSAYPRAEAHYVPTLVKRGATIGANATILCGVTLGEHCLVGAGAVVTKSVSAYAVVYGNPAAQRGWACACGAALRGRRAQLLRCPCGQRYQLRNGGLTATRAA